MVFLVFLAFSVSEEEESSRSKVGEERENERSLALEGLGLLIYAAQSQWDTMRDR